MEADQSYSTTTHSQGQAQFGHASRKQAAFDTLKRIKQSPVITAVTCAYEQESLEQTYDRLSQTIKTEDGRLVQSAILDLVKLLKEGQAPVASPYCIEALKSLVSYFNKLARKLQDEQIQVWEQESSNTEYLMLQALSAISQIISDSRNDKQFVFPFNRSFLQNVFMVSSQLIGASSRRKEIVKILSVVLVAVTTSGRLIKEFDLVPRLRQTVLENYRHAEDVNTFNRMNRCLKAVILISPLSLVEMKKYKLLETVARFTNPSNFVEVMSRIGLCKFINKGVVVDPNLLVGMSKSAYT